jgi:biotin transport system substrate-specific component
MRFDKGMKALSISRTSDWVFVAFQILFFSVLTALCAQIKFYLPFTPVPITLQSFAVIMAGATLGSHRGAISQAFLLVLGGLGFQVFTGDVSGWQALLGPTGGYILGFILAAYVAGAMREKGYLKGFWRSALWMFIASFFIFLPGVVWLKVATSLSWQQAVLLGFVPFLAGDVVKTLMAAGSHWTLSKWNRS